MKKILLLIVGTFTFTSCSDASIAESTTSTSVATTRKFEYTITVGTNTGPKVFINVVRGQVVTLKVVNPLSHDEVHLHGYDLTTGQIDKGEFGTMTFTAKNTGEFELESHETEELISVLKVTEP